MANLQLPLTDEDLALHATYSSSNLESIYGAGCTSRPDVMLMFMNPTARNISAVTDWRGIRAPWLGVRKTWKLLSMLKLLDEEIVSSMYSSPSVLWDEKFAESLYSHVAKRKLYITNLAKCTQPDARHLPDATFRAYLPSVLDEIKRVKPKKIITFGNQVSSILLGQTISVSHYPSVEYEALQIKGETYNVYPTYYPVGQGQRNMPKAVLRIQKVVGLASAFGTTS